MNNLKPTWKKQVLYFLIGSLHVTCKKYINNKIRGDGKIRFVAYDIESAKEFDKIMKDNEIKRFVQRNSIARNEDVKEKTT